MSVFFWEDFFSQKLIILGEGQQGKGGDQLYSYLPLPNTRKHLDDVVNNVKTSI